MQSEILLQAVPGRPLCAQQIVPGKRLKGGKGLGDDLGKMTADPEYRAPVGFCELLQKQRTMADAGRDEDDIAPDRKSVV